MTGTVGNRTQAKSLIATLRRGWPEVESDVGNFIARAEVAGDMSLDVEPKKPDGPWGAYIAGWEIGLCDTPYSERTGGGQELNILQEGIDEIALTLRNKKHL